MTPLDLGRQSPSQSDEQGAGIVGVGVGDGPGPDVMAAATLDGDIVVTADGEHVGKISDIMLDVRSGRIAYAIGRRIPRDGDDPSRDSVERLDFERRRKGLFR